MPQIVVTPHQYLKIQEFTERLKNHSIDALEYKLLLEGLGLPVKKIMNASWMGITTQLVVRTQDDDSAHFVAEFGIPIHVYDVDPNDKHLTHRGYANFRVRLLKSAATTI